MLIFYFFNNECESHLKMDILEVVLLKGDIPKGLDLAVFLQK